MKALIILPAFNESQVIYKVLKSIPKKIRGLSQVEIVVVNDGSSDITSKEAKRAGIKVISHILNRGLGAAIKTGLDLAKRKRVDLVITFDSDGQHHPEDIKKIVRPILLQNADIVIGSRFKSSQKIPKDRIILNRLANLATLLMFGVTSSDSQSGFRAFSKKAIDLIDFRGERMDFSSEILYEAKRNDLKVKEIPIKAIYTDYSRKKGQKNLNAIPIMARFLVRFLK